MLVAAPTAAAAPPNPGIVVENGVTQPAFGYADAIRERVWVEADFDTDLDGVNDQIALDIIRPALSDLSIKVPVIMDASPYYSTLGRGNESELKSDIDGDGLLDRWPLFYDNYFVPRGYAVVLLDMVGTSNSTGCPVTGGTPDHLSAVVGIDWLNGRRKGYDKDGNEVVADWHNGRTGMIGKSYDGTLANGAASTGVEGPHHDRPDLGHLLLVRLHALERRRHARQQLPVEPLQHGHEPVPARALRSGPRDACRDRRGRDGRLHAVLART